MMHYKTHFLYEPLTPFSTSMMINEHSISKLTFYAIQFCALLYFTFVLKKRYKRHKAVDQVCIFITIDF